MLRLAARVFVLLWPAAAFAGRPLLTDDATLTPAHSCQLESWYQHDTWTDVLNLFPACNFFGDVELTMGWSHADDDAYSAQLKQVYRELQANDWGWGAAAGVLHAHTARGDDNDWYTYLPLSFSLADDRWQIHLNAGVHYRSAYDAIRASWGIGTVYAPSSRWSWFVESAGSDGDALLQGGGSVALWRDRVQLDATLGRVLGGAAAGNFASVGIDVYGLSLR